MFVAPATWPHGAGVVLTIRVRAGESPQAINAHRTAPRANTAYMIRSPRGGGPPRALRQVLPDREAGHGRDGRDLPREADRAGRVREAARHQADPPAAERPAALRRPVRRRGQDARHA